MARKVKCQICKKELTNETAYKVTKGSKNLYYCSQEEYEDMLGEKGRKDKFYQFLAQELHQKYIPPMVTREINNLLEAFGYDTIKQTFIECKEPIHKFLEQQGYVIQYNTCRYIFAIIGNNIVRVDKQRQKEIEALFENKINDNQIDVDIINIEPQQTTKKHKVHDISAFLE